MRKLTLLPLALSMATCSSNEECNPFTEAMDCVHGEEPTPLRRQGDIGREFGGTSYSSPQVGPSAGSANGPGPTAGSANGRGPGGLGSTSGAGPSAGSANGSGPSPGSTNAADSTMVTDSAGLGCAGFCSGLYNTCAAEFSRFSSGKYSLGNLISGCQAWCECLSSVAPACMQGFLAVSGPCTQSSSCLGIGQCLEQREDAVEGLSACESLNQGAGEHCGEFFLPF